MAKKPARSQRPVKATNPSRGAPLTLPPISTMTKRSIRGIAKELVGQHPTEIALRIREGLLSENLRLSLKYLTFVGDRTDGRPVETHRMVGLQEGPSGTYDLSKLPPAEQKKLLALLRAARDTTESKGEVK